MQLRRLCSKDATRNRVDSEMFALAYAHISKLVLFGRLVTLTSQILVSQVVLLLMSIMLSLEFY